MSRLLYLAFSGGGLQGGHKMVFRHVEALRDLGFDALVYTGKDNKIPQWFAHRAPIEVGTPVRPDDLLVIPDDATDVLARMVGSSRPAVVFGQSNPTQVIANLAPTMDRFPPGQRPTLMVVGPMLAELYARLYPDSRLGIVPCFADERIFRPGPDRQRAVAFTPRKRPQGGSAIRTLHDRLDTGRPALAWRELSDATEAQVAETFGASTLHLSLSRMESVGITALEAMASGCVCAGFTGVGGRAYATADNGFWAAEDDVEAAAEALARADDVVCTGGPSLQHMLEAGRETAERWSYARFRESLEAFWMEHAPGTRLQAGPLG